MIPVQSGWIVKDDELQPFPYEGKGLPTIEEYAEAVASVINTDEVEEHREM